MFRRSNSRPHHSLRSDHRALDSDRSCPSCLSVSRWTDPSDPEAGSLHRPHRNCPGLCSSPNWQHDASHYRWHPYHSRCGSHERTWYQQRWTGQDWVCCGTCHRPRCRFPLSALNNFSVTLYTAQRHFSTLRLRIVLWMKQYPRFLGTFFGRESC